MPHSPQGMFGRSSMFNTMPGSGLNSPQMPQRPQMPQIPGAPAGMGQMGHQFGGVRMPPMQFPQPGMGGQGAPPPMQGGPFGGLPPGGQANQALIQAFLANRQQQMADWRGNTLGRPAPTPTPTASGVPLQQAPGGPLTAPPQIGPAPGSAAAKPAPAPAQPDAAYQLYLDNERRRQQARTPVRYGR